MKRILDLLTLLKIMDILILINISFYLMRKYCRDGQHRAAVLAHLYGVDFKAKF